MHKVFLIKSKQMDNSEKKFLNCQNKEITRKTHLLLLFFTDNLLIWTLVASESPLLFMTNNKSPTQE